MIRVVWRDIGTSKHGVMIGINKDNYDYYKRLFGVIWKFLSKEIGIDYDSSNSPINVLESWEKKNPALARRGLKEGLMDFLTSVREYPRESVEELNRRLIEKGFPSVGVLTARIRNTPAKVIERGRIRNLDEYYVIKEVLDDLDSGLTEEDREILNSIFGEYEAKKTMR